MQLGEGAILSNYTVVTNKVFVKCLHNKKFRTVKRKKRKTKAYITSSPSTGYLLSVSRDPVSSKCMNFAYYIEDR